MTDRDEKVREAATFLLERLDDFDRAGDNMTEDGQRDWFGHVLPALSRVRTALSRPAPGVPGAEEVEAIRRRHTRAMHLNARPSEARVDCATLLALLDAARAELAEVREAAARARHDQELQETWDAARAALAKDAPT